MVKSLTTQLNAVKSKQASASASMGTSATAQPLAPPAQQPVVPQQPSGQRAQTGGQSGGDRPCPRCHKTGHAIWDCPLPDTRTCYTCNMVGHVSNKCPQKQQPRQQQRRIITCYNCRQQGHMSYNCPQPRAHVNAFGAYDKHDTSSGGSASSGYPGGYSAAGAPGFSAAGAPPGYGVGQGQLQQGGQQGSYGNMPPANQGGWETRPIYGLSATATASPSFAEDLLNCKTQLKQLMDERSDKSGN